MSTRPEHSEILPLIHVVSLGVEGLSPHESNAEGLSDLALITLTGFAYDGMELAVPITMTLGVAASLRDCLTALIAARPAIDRN